MPKLPDPLDVEAGRRLRLARVAKGLSQTELGGVLGITFQQVQKYEKGTNRISVSKLRKCARALGVGVTQLTGEDADAADGEDFAAGVDLLKTDPGLARDIAQLSMKDRAAIRRIVAGLAATSVMREAAE